MCCCQLDVISTLLMTVQFENITIDICLLFGCIFFVCISLQLFFRCLGCSLHTFLRSVTWGPPDSPTHQSVRPLVRQPISPTNQQSDSPLARQPINARGIPSLINILQGIPTDHEGGSYIHVPYITRVFLRVTPVMNLPKCVPSPEIFQSPDGSREFGK